MHFFIIVYPVKSETGIPGLSGLLQSFHFSIATLTIIGFSLLPSKRLRTDCMWWQEENKRQWPNHSKGSKVQCILSHKGNWIDQTLAKPGLRAAMRRLPSLLFNAENTRSERLPWLFQKGFHSHLWLAALECKSQEAYQLNPSFARVQLLSCDKAKGGIYNIPCWGKLLKFCPEK